VGQCPAYCRGWQVGAGSAGAGTHVGSRWGTGPSWPRTSHAGCPIQRPRSRTNPWVAARDPLEDHGNAALLAWSTSRVREDDRAFAPYLRRAAMSGQALEERRNRFPDGVFARELVRLNHGGVAPSKTLLALTKGSENDRQYGKDLAWAIEHFVISTGVARAERVRHIDSEEGRRLLAFALRIIGMMKRGKGSRKGEIRLDGPDGFWGRTEPPASRSQRLRRRPTRLRKPDDAMRAPLEFQRTVDEARPLKLDSRPYKARKKLARRYCPKGQVGGLAARHGVTTRTIGNWARFLRVAGFLGCKQPPRKAEDAWPSRRQGDYPYGVWRLLRALPSKMMQRLRLFWGELNQASGDRLSGLQRELERIEHLRIRAEYGHERGPPRKRRSELERERTRGELAAQELVRKPLP
jgi:hypothetical protein